MTAATLPADWPAPPGVSACTTLRHGAGGSPPPFDHFNLGGSDDDPGHIANNRAELIDHLALPSPPCWLHQVHGIQVQRFTCAITPAPIADAAVTANPGVVLAVLTADCLPVLLAARDGSEIAAAHAGWRGLAAGILEATVRAMATPAQELLAWLGPAAGPLRYEVGHEVFAAFTRHSAQAAAAFVPIRPQHWRVDLSALAKQRLAELGIAPAHIFGGGICTMSDPQRFYSHRRDARTGRMASLIWRHADRL